MTQGSNNLAQFVKNLKCGGVNEHENIAIVPLKWQNEHSKTDYLLAEEAINKELLTVTEIGEHGNVPELQVTSTADEKVLLIDGEELVGAKQNRILNTSILLAAMGEVTIPVSCVEQGRWRHISPKFASGGFSPAELRARKSRSVKDNLKAQGKATSDQHEVWASVAESAAKSGASSPTMAMHDVFQQSQDNLAAYTAALKYPANASGCIVAIAGKFAALDLFDKPQTLQRLWERLVTGYALDAISAEPTQDKFTEKGAGALLEHIGECECEAYPSVGLGKDWRFESDSIVGQALIVDSTAIHVSVFPKINDDSRRRPHIRRPSRRRHNG